MNIFYSIPKELIYVIFSNFSYEELENAKLVCKLWRSKVREYLNSKEFRSFSKEKDLIPCGTTFPRACGHCHYYNIDGSTDMTNYYNVDGDIIIYMDSIKKTLVVGDIINIGEQIGTFLFTDGNNFIKKMAQFGHDFEEGSSAKFIKIFEGQNVSVSQNIPFPQSYWKNYCSEFTSNSKMSSHNKNGRINTNNLMSMKKLSLKNIESKLPQYSMRFSTIEKTLTHYSSLDKISIIISDVHCVEQCERNMHEIDFDSNYGFGVRYFSTFFNWGGYSYTLVFDGEYSQKDTVESKKKIFEKKELKLHYIPEYIDKNVFDHDIIFVKCEPSIAEKFVPFLTKNVRMD